MISSLLFFKPVQQNQTTLSLTDQSLVQVVLSALSAQESDSASLPGKVSTCSPLSQWQEEIETAYVAVTSSELKNTSPVCLSKVQLENYFLMLCAPLPLSQRVAFMDRIAQLRPKLIMDLRSEILETLGVPILVMWPLTECNIEQRPVRRIDIPPVIIISPLLRSSSYILRFQQIIDRNGHSCFIAEDGFFPRQEKAVKQMRDFLLMCSNSFTRMDLFEALQGWLNTCSTREEKFNQLLTLWDLAYCLRIEDPEEKVLLEVCDRAIEEWLNDQPWDAVSTERLCEQLERSLFKSSYSWISTSSQPGCRALQSIFSEHLLDLLRSCSDKPGAIKEVLSNLAAVKLPKDTTDQDLARLAHYCPRLRHLECFEWIWMTDEGMEQLKALTDLRYLDLSSCQQITDQGVECLKGLRQLCHLQLGWSHQITDEALMHLRLLTHLEYLDLSGCSQITDQGIEHLTRCKKLRYLNLSRCEYITDKGIEHLEPLEDLNSLDLSRCDQITDRGVGALTALTRLCRLVLSGCHQITDEGVEQLETLTDLAHLDLSWCKTITDTGVAHLKKITTLQTLDLSMCEGISEDACEDFRRERGEVTLFEM